MRLLAQIEALQDLVVLVEVVFLQVVEQLAASARHGEQATASVEVLAIGSKVFRQVVNTSAEKRDLNIAGARVSIVRLKVADDFRFIDCFAVWHVGYQFTETVAPCL